MNYNQLLGNHNEIVKLINYRVKVTTINNTTCVGFLQTIDPVSGTLVIISHSNDNENGSSTNLHFIISHSINSFQVLDEKIEPKLKSKIDLLINPTVKLSDSEMKTRKQKLIDWFKLNRIPIENKENNELKVASMVILKPPYSKNDCVCSNDIVVRRIHDLMDRMPA